MLPPPPPPPFLALLFRGLRPRLRGPGLSLPAFAGCLRPPPPRLGLRLAAPAFPPFELLRLLRLGLSLLAFFPGCFRPRPPRLGLRLLGAFLAALELWRRLRLRLRLLSLAAPLELVLLLRLLRLLGLLLAALRRVSSSAAGDYGWGCGS